jgi:tRNA-splicing ligase RtcB
MIKNVITKGRVPVKMWLDFCEDGAVNQAVHLSELPFVYKHVALMPDAHQGYGVPIGCVFAADDVVVPNAVGVDIGCGMIAMETSLQAEDIALYDIQRWAADVQRTIPTGFQHHDKPQYMPLTLDSGSVVEGGIVEQEFAAAKKQMGTLGGGNHFIELQKDEAGFVWVMIHSGSRNVGLKVAQHYNKLAKTLNDKWGVTTPPQYQLNHLPMGDISGQNYMKEMQWCVEFAYHNRKNILDNVLRLLSDYVEFKDTGEINIAHNFAAVEHHYGKSVVVHRKGATKADRFLLGIIPGSQGSASYIVRGLGCDASFKSCSHGAGRRMSRSQARKYLNLREEQAKMGDVIHNMMKQKQVDEAASAYKDIDEVMENQTDLVEIMHKLTPLAVVKA